MADVEHAVGPLSGKSLMAVVVWLAAWGALFPLWHRSELGFPLIWKGALVLIAVGFILTFPPVFTLFHG